MSPEETSRQTKKLLRDFDLVEVAKRPVRTYSGGMKRRIDLAMSLIASPPVIFLDEPTTGLDPRSRLTMWQIIKQMASSGTTILLTTQYMEEADYLANSILVIDDGQVIAEGTPDELKARVGSDRLEFTFKNTGHFEKAKAVIATDAMQADRDRQVVSIPSDGGVGTLRTILRQLDDAQIAVDGVSLHRPTLDDVFMSLTGREASVDDQVKRS
jgi:ABC-2 type transport system ATP-binding protein